MPSWEKPPIFLITLDAVRRDGVSCYRGVGEESNLTPNLEDFSDSAALFQEGISTGGGTLNGMTGLLGSQYRINTGQRNQHANGWLAEELKDGNYATAGFHSNPRLRPANNFHQGFDEYPKGKNKNTTKTNPHWSSRLKRTFRNTVHNVCHQSQLLYQFLKALQFCSTLPYERGSEITNRAINWIDELDGSPPFMFVHYMDAHDPYVPIQKGQGTITGMNRFKISYLNSYLNIYTGTDWSVETPSERIITELRELYHMEISYLDRQIGRLVSALKERNLFERSLIIITSDHGEEFLDHGWVRHKQLYDELIRVPLLIKPPAGEPYSEVVEGLISGVDIPPTILEYAGLEIPKFMKGQPKRNAIRTGISDRNHAISFNIPTYSNDPCREVAIRTRTKKLIRDECGEFYEDRELYDLEDDPNETENIISNNSDVADSLNRVLESELGWEEWRVERWNRHGQKVTPEIKQQLESLGYT